VVAGKKSKKFAMVGDLGPEQAGKGEVALHDGPVPS